jgi:hypothetical protein
MQYKIEKLIDGFASVRFEDGSWAQILLHKNMTENELDEIVGQFAPKKGEAPDFIFEGQVRQVKKIAEFVDASVAMTKPTEAEKSAPDWVKKRLMAYGQVQNQIEFIVENGLDAWVEHVKEIKARFPKN